MGLWSVTAVNCSRADRWESDSWAISTGLGEPDMAIGTEGTDGGDGDDDPSNEDRGIKMGVRGG